MSNDEPRAPYDVNPVLRIQPQENGRNLGGEKETTTRLIYACIVDGKIETPIDIRWYMGRSKSASTVYCTIWVHDRHSGTYTAGHGRAGGYGYHKESAAADEAMRSAGIQLTKSFGGCGSGPVEVACRAIAAHLGLPTDGVFI